METNVILGIVFAFVFGLALGWKVTPLFQLHLAQRETARQVRLVQQLTAQLTRTSGESLDWERKASEYRNTIGGVLVERDNWNRLYDEQSIGHGNAQAIMMDAITFLQRKLQAAGVEVQLPDVVRETQELYRERHIAPTLQRTGAAPMQRAPRQDQTMSEPEAEK